MTLIIGGEAQGKRTYAESLFTGEYTAADCGECPSEDVFSAELIVDYHLMIKRIADAESYTREMCERNPTAIVTMNEVGSGIIPMEKEERKYRETAGRCGCIIAENAEEVIRMFSGIPMKIKQRSCTHYEGSTPEPKKV